LSTKDFKGETLAQFLGGFITRFLDRFLDRFLGHLLNRLLDGLLNHLLNRLLDRLLGHLLNGLLGDSGRLLGSRDRFLGRKVLVSMLVGLLHAGRHQRRTADKNGAGSSDHWLTHLTLLFNEILGWGKSPALIDRTGNISHLSGDMGMKIQTTK